MTHFWIPRVKIIEPKALIQLPSPRVAGRFQLRAGRGNTVQRVSAWSDNLILNGGLDLIGGSSSTFLSRVRVGTGTTAPAVTDTALEAELALTDTAQSNLSVTDSNSPYSMTSTAVRRFAQGAAAGNLTEVGIGSSTVLFSRALIVDGAGAPTTLPVGADEFLDVAYQLIGLPPLGDEIGTVVITGSATHNFVARAAGLPSLWFLRAGAGVLAQLTTTGAGAQVYSGAIGAITDVSPAGTTDAATSVQTDAYVAGSFTRTGSMSFGLDDGNVGGVAAARIRWGAIAGQVSDSHSLAFQYSYDPVIAKDSSTLLTLGFRLTWARA